MRVFRPVLSLLYWPFLLTPGFQLALFDNVVRRVNPVSTYSVRCSTVK